MNSSEQLGRYGRKNKNDKPFPGYRKPLRRQNHDRCLKRQPKDKLLGRRQQIHKHGQDMPEICNWKWEEHTM